MSEPGTSGRRSPWALGWSPRSRSVAACLSAPLWAAGGRELAWAGVSCAAAGAGGPGAGRQATAAEPPPGSAAGPQRWSPSLDGRCAVRQRRRRACVGGLSWTLRAPKRCRGIGFGRTAAQDRATSAPKRCRGNACVRFAWLFVRPTGDRGEARMLLRDAAYPTGHLRPGGYATSPARCLLTRRLSTSARPQATDARRRFRGSASGRLASGGYGLCSAILDRRR